MGVCFRSHKVRLGVWSLEGSFVDATHLRDRSTIIVFSRSLFNGFLLFAVTDCTWKILFSCCTLGVRVFRFASRHSLLLFHRVLVQFVGWVSSSATIQLCLLGCHICYISLCEFSMDAIKKNMMVSNAYTTKGDVSIYRWMILHLYSCIKIFTCQSKF